jgi:hypothetical protein
MNTVRHDLRNEGPQLKLRLPVDDSKLNKTFDD